MVLAGATVIIALLGMFATGVAFMYGLSIASVLAVLLVLASDSYDAADYIRDYAEFIRLVKDGNDSAK